MFPYKPYHVLPTEVRIKTPIELARLEPHRVRDALSPEGVRSLCCCRMPVQLLRRLWRKTVFWGSWSWGVSLQHLELLSVVKAYAGHDLQHARCCRMGSLMVCFFLGGLDFELVAG